MQRLGPCVRCREAFALGEEHVNANDRFGLANGRFDKTKRRTVIWTTVTWCLVRASELDRGMAKVTKLCIKSFTKIIQIDPQTFGPLVPDHKGTLPPLPNPRLNSPLSHPTPDPVLQIPYRSHTADPMQIPTPDPVLQIPYRSHTDPILQIPYRSHPRSRTADPVQIPHRSHTADRICWRAMAWSRRVPPRLQREVVEPPALVADQDRARLEPADAAHGAAGVVAQLAGGAPHQLRLLSVEPRRLPPALALGSAHHRRRSG